MPHRGLIGKVPFAFLEVKQLAQQDRREGVDRSALRTCSEKHHRRWKFKSVARPNRDCDPGTRASSRERHVPRCCMVFAPVRTVSKQVTGMSAPQEIEHQAELDVAHSQNTMVLSASLSNRLLSTGSRKHCHRATAVRGTCQPGPDLIGHPSACTIGLVQVDLV